MAAISKARSQGSKRTLSIWVIALLTSIIVYQIASRSGGEEESYPLLKLKHQLDDATFEYGLAPPRGKAIALPSVRVAKEEFKSDERYGGKGDKSHLGGFTDMDHHGISPAVWKWMMTYIGVHSILDVGCGRGISTSWFYFHGADVLCVEGSHDAIENTVIPDTSRIVEHDFSRGPWWPEKTYDAVWCVEFLEHVGRNLQYNYIKAFRKSAIIFASHSLWGGHHHVEVHDDAFWIEKMTMFGFVYSPGLTQVVREAASNEKSKGIAPNGIKLNAQHIWLSMQVYINPAVASLPQHSHLMAELGCYEKQEKGVVYKRECGEGDDPQAKLESVLPEGYRPLVLTAAQDQKWFDHVKTKVKPRQADEELNIGKTKNSTTPAVEVKK